MIKSLLVAGLLGCAQILLGIGAGKVIPGVIGCGVEAVLGILYPPAAFIAFPFVVLALLAFGDGGTASGEPAAHFRIVGLSGPLAGREFELSAMQPSLEFGVLGNEVRFPAKTGGVSRHHCKVILRDSMAYLIDLDSTYGTYIRVPPQQLQPHREYALQDRTEFCLGSETVMFRVLADR